MCMSICFSFRHLIDTHRNDFVCMDHAYGDTTYGDFVSISLCFLFVFSFSFFSDGVVSFPLVRVHVALQELRGKKIKVLNWKHCTSVN